MRGSRFAVVLVVAVVMLTLAVSVAAADPVPLDPDKDLDGAGVDGDPYIITSASELQAMGGNLGAHYKLGSDIDASDTEDWNGGNGFEPIGECGVVSAGDCQGSPFEGEFNGDGHTISNLFIDSDEDDTGLFGGTDGATITNVHLDAIDVTGGIFNTGGIVGYAVSTAVSDVSVQGSVSGSATTGGLVGRGQQTSITNATAELTVSGGSTVGGAVGQLRSGDVTRTTVSGDLQGSLHTRGGVVGNNGGTVTESLANVDLSGSYNLGGLVGVNEGTVSDSYATGAVSSTSDPSSNPRGAGGLIGLNDGGAVEGSYATGTVDGVTTLGGLVGTDDSGTVSNSYWDTQTTGQAVSGGNGEGLTTAEMTGDRAEDNMDFDFDELWDVSEGESVNGAIVYYPTLQNNPQDPAPSATLYAGGDGIQGDPYGIENWYHLHNVRENLDSEFILNNNLDESTAGYDELAGETADGGAGFKPVGENGDGFSGTFDGDDHTISGLYIDRPTEADVGLFGVVVDYSQFTDQPSIERVGIENVTVTGDDNVGGLVGYASATVADSYVTGTVTGDNDVGGIVGQLVGGMVTRSSTTTTVDGSMSVGGLVGFQSGGDVTDSNTTGTVTGDDWVGGVVGYNRGGDVSTSYTNSTVDGNYGIGGLVGTNGAGGNVSESHATGTVSGADSVGGLVGENGAEFGDETGGTVSESYATGAVDGSGNVGGLIGRSTTDGETTNAYWDVETTGQTASAGGGEGLATEQMTGINAGQNMAFAFDGPWYVTPDYPELTEYEHRGEGTEDNPYEISNVDELQLIENDLSANYTLIQDIDASESKDWYGGAGFNPIGEFSDGNEFTGAFDGDEHTISELYINRSNDFNIGLFGYTDGATIERVGIENIDVDGSEAVGGLVGFLDGGATVSESYVTGTVDGDDWVGGLVGYNLEGAVSESYTTSAVTGNDWVGGLVGYNEDTVSNSYATVAATGAEYVGGLIGVNLDEVTESYATGSVDGSNNVGGLVGRNGGRVSGSYANGSVDGSENVGGFVGNNDGTLSNSFASGTINGSVNVGGFVGANAEEITTSFAIGYVNPTGTDIGGFVGSSSGTVVDAYWDTESTNQLASDGGEGLTTAQMTGANASADGNMDGFDFENTWYLTVAYPSLSPPFEGEGTEAEPYELKNVLHLQEMRKDLSANYRLVDDIDASETEGWFDGAGFEPIGTSSERFEGTINGNGHTISNLAINRSEMTFVGLFGVTVGESTVKNVALVAVDIHGDNEVGGLTGFLGTGVTVSESSVTGTISGNRFVGGIVGYNYRGTVSKSYATGAIEGTENVGGLVGESYEATVSESYATSTVDGTNYVGGLVGHNDDGNVIMSYATGEVNGTNHIGGVIGNSSGTVDDAYWDIESTNQSDSDGGTGLTTARMTGLNATESENMGALDFATSWTATDSYPLLQWSVADLELDLANSELTEGETTTATVTLTTVDRRAVGATTTSDYSSSDASVATVDRGTVTAERGGSTVIKAARARVSDEASLSVRRISSGGGGSGSSGSSGGSTSPAVDDVDSGPGDIEMNDDGSVSVSTAASANQPARFEFGDSVRDTDSGTRFGRINLTFGEDIDVSVRARSTNRDELPDRTPALGRDGDSSASTSDRAVSYVEFTVASAGVDVSDRVQSSTIEFDTSREQLEARGVAVENVTLHRYDEDAEMWAELDTEIVDESNGQVAYESTTPGFSMFAVGERADERNTEPTDDPTEPAETEPTDDPTEPAETEPTDDSTEPAETNDNTPGFGLPVLFVGLVSLLILYVLVGRFRRTD